MWFAPPSALRLHHWYKLGIHAERIWGWEFDPNVDPITKFTANIVTWAETYGYWPFGRHNVIHDGILSNQYDGCLSTFIPRDFNFSYRKNGDVERIYGTCLDCGINLIQTPLERDPFILIVKMAAAEEKGWYVYQP